MNEIKKDEFFTILFFLIYVIIYILSISIFGMGNSYANIRYYFLIFSIIINLIILLKKKGLFNKKTIANNLLYPVILSLIFIFISYFKATSVGYGLSFRTIVQSSYILLPALYAYCIINNLPMKSIVKLMSITTIITVILYFTDDNHMLLDFLDLSKLLSIDFIRFRSFTESGICSEIFLQLYLFFVVVGKCDEYKKSAAFYRKICFVFTLLCFKRLAILFLILTFILNKFIKLSKTFKKNHNIILSIFFTIATLLYTKFITGEIFTNVDTYKFSTGRDFIMKLWSYKNYFSFGYGTSLLVINRYLEMDFVQIYMELGIIAVFLFCYCYSKLLNKKYYSYFIIVYTFANLLFSSSLPSTLPWTILLINITCISSEKIIKNDSNREKNENEEIS